MRKIVAGLFMSLDGVVEAPDKWTFAYLQRRGGTSGWGSDGRVGHVVAGPSHVRGFRRLLARQDCQRRPVCRLHQQHPKGRRLQNSQGCRVAELPTDQQRCGEADHPTQAATRKEHLYHRKCHAGPIAAPREPPRPARAPALPIVVGTGKRLFEDWTGRVPLKLVGSRAFSNGALSLTYESSGR